MNINVVDTLFDYTQNLRSSEDIITGTLATAFHYCPKFSEVFFKNSFGINIPKDGNFYVATGYSTVGYAWLKDLNFRPDILISNKDEDWEKEPDGEQLILIESKLWSKFGPNQINKYKKFKDLFSKKASNSVHMILISIEEHEKGPFDQSLTWNKVIQLSENIFKEIDDDLAEKLVLKDIIVFMKLRLVPSLDDFKKNNELCPKEILKRIYNRLDRNKLKLPIKPKNISDFYEKDGLKSINVSDSEKMSYSTLEINKKEYSLCCAYSKEKKRVIFWIECEDTEDLEILFQTDTLNFNKKSWIDDWFDALLKIQKRIELLTLGK